MYHYRTFAIPLRWTMRRRGSLRMMERTLQQSTYEVFAARDGPHAAHLLCEPDGSRLALIDWMMPQLDRSAVCREVRSRHGGAYAYILLLTAKRSSEDIVQGLRLDLTITSRNPVIPQSFKRDCSSAPRIIHAHDPLIVASLRSHVLHRIAAVQPAR